MTYIERPEPGSEFTVLKATGDIEPGRPLEVTGWTVTEEGVEPVSGIFVPPLPPDDEDDDAPG